MTTANNKISVFINGQLPEFVRENNPLFISFLEAYYEYLEQANLTPSYGKTVERAENLLSYSDIDTTLDDFTVRLYNEFMSYFPQDLAANEKTILKHIKEFYRTKGSVKSYEFLFRALYGEEITITYPKDNILRASDSTWTVDKSLNITDICVGGHSNNSVSGIELFANTQITGLQSNAKALVERTSVSYQSGVLIQELYISNQTRDFLPGETIYTTDQNGTSLRANVFSGIVSSITVQNPGTKYNIGDPVELRTVANTTGSGATAYISSVSLGNVSSVQVIKSGAGFQSNDKVFFSGDGVGASANVASVLDTGFYHPITYHLNHDLLGNYDSIHMDSANYGFPNTATSNDNTSMAIALSSSYLYSNCGPLNIIYVQQAGQNYRTVPSADIVGNNVVKFLGMIGKVEIANSGIGYAVNDAITFVNIKGGFGTGANGSVQQVGANGEIQRVLVSGLPGYLPGGEGYNINFPPEVTINTASGSGANLFVSSIMAVGSPCTGLSVTTDDIGKIQTISIGSRGFGYNVAPEVILTGVGDGTGTAYANIVSGIYTYPGRFLDETGFVSGFSFLQDRDYYQNFSYVVRVKKSIEDYRNYVLQLVHPAGTKLWGEYVIREDQAVDNTITVPQTNVRVYLT